jgi:hypothetical protein
LITVLLKEKIRIASGQGFWGDLPRAPVDQIRNGDVDYLVMDYLAEVTMSIMQKQRMRNPVYGYALDFVEMLDETLAEIKSKGIKVVSNAGGVNPIACKDAILKTAKKHRINDINIAVVDGDDILEDLDTLIAQGHEFLNMDTGEPMSEIKDRLLSANVYFGARPVVEALKQGADIVVTGRVTDASLTLGPMVHEFNWGFDDYDKLAAGTIAGHIIECGGQASGGNFTDWEKVDDLANIGFPIIEAYRDSLFYVTKHKNSGGLINEMTVKEQLLYEIKDPANYITPDVTADFTSVQLREIEPDRVEVKGIKGKPETSLYKISASYKNGYKISSSLVYCWPEAVKKALHAAKILKLRADKLGIGFDDFRVELIGINACDENPEKLSEELNGVSEVGLRISARGKSSDELDRFGREIAPLILTGPGGVTGFAGGRPKSSEIVAFWPALLDKNACTPNVTLYKP